MPGLTALIIAAAGTHSIGKGQNRSEEGDQLPIDAMPARQTISTRLVTKSENGNAQSRNGSDQACARGASPPLNGTRRA
jgi:hypothetical protein